MCPDHLASPLGPHTCLHTLPGEGAHSCLGRAGLPAGSSVRSCPALPRKGRLGFLPWMQPRATPLLGITDWGERGGLVPGAVGGFGEGGVLLQLGD